MIKINKFNKNDKIDELSILKYLEAEGIIDLDDAKKKMREKEFNDVLSRHQYSIFQDKDGRWKTTVKDETKKSKRRIIAKKTERELKEAVVKHYLDLEDEKYIIDNSITLEKIFPEWIVYKSKHSQSTSYIVRLKTDWNKYYKDSPIVKVSLHEINFIYVDTWVHETIEKYSLTKKQYYNMAVIIRQMLDYLVEKGIIESNIFNRVKVNKKMFTTKQKPKSELQVFNTEDEKKIKQLAMEKYNTNHRAITPLAILFNFNLGLRVCELVALRWSDIEGNYLNISRMEIADYTADENGNVYFSTNKVVDYVKSEAGVRRLYLNNEAIHILDMIKKRNHELKIFDGDYIFVNANSSTRLTRSSINKYLYRLCDEINANRLSSHKIRKTYISSLIDGGININKVRELAGHEDERTTLNNYCFDRNTDVHTENELENICRKSSLKWL